MRFLLDTEALQKTADDYSIGVEEVRDIVKIYFKYAGKNFLSPRKSDSVSCKDKNGKWIPYPRKGQLGNEQKE